MVLRRHESSHSHFRGFVSFVFLCIFALSMINLPSHLFFHCLAYIYPFFLSPAISGLSIFPTESYCIFAQ